MAEILKQLCSKQDGESRLDACVADFNLSDLAEEGRLKLSECRAAVDRMLAEAKVEAENIRELARKEGYQAGLKTAERDVADRIERDATVKSQHQIERLQEAVKKLHHTHEEWMQDCAESLSGLAITIAERVVKHQLAESHDVILGWIQEALSSTRLSRNVTLCLHPETLREIGDTLESIVSQLEGVPEQVELISDSQLDRYEVVVTQSGGQICAGLNAQLGRLGELLKR